MRLAFFAIGAALAFAGAAHANEPSSVSSAEGGRYAMTPAEGGFLRLDTQTGAVSLCTVKDGMSVCRASADERAALEDEIARLTRENADLRARLADGSARSGGLPSEEEFERSLSFVERFVRRIMRLFREEAPPDRI